MIIENSLGTIKLDKKIFAKSILEGFADSDVHAYLATPAHRLLSNFEKKSSISDVAQNINVELDENWLCVEFCIVTDFGESINAIIDDLSKSISMKLKEMFPKVSIKLIIKLVGVKSKYIAERDQEFVKIYELKR